MTIFDKLQQNEYNNWGLNIPDHEWCNEANTDIEVKFILDELKIKRDELILDLFYSWGRHSLPLIKLGYNVTGLDISGEMISKAKLLSGDNNIEYICEDFISFSSHIMFDKIYSIQSSFFEPWRTENEVLDMLKKVRKLLKPKGQYLFGWNNNYNRADMAKKRWGKKLNQTNISRKEIELFQDYSLKEQMEIVKKSHFKIIKVFNNYFDKNFDSNKEGLIFIVENEFRTTL